jgi:hypothetical protein
MGGSRLSVKEEGGERATSPRGPLGRGGGEQAARGGGRGGKEGPLGWAARREKVKRRRKGGWAEPKEK